MSLILRTFVGCLCSTLCLCISCLAKEWRGIVPLHSTRSDVIKLLGEPKHLQWDYRDYFFLDAEWVTFQWVDPTCRRKLPVEPDSEVRPDALVLNISVTPKKPFPVEELHLPPHKDELNFPLGDFSLIDWIGDTDDGDGSIVMDSEEGFSFSTSKEGVTGHSYYPTAREYKAWMQEHSGCQSSL
jgi:hypothetical protein